MEFICIFYCVFEYEGFTGSSYWKVPHLSIFCILSFENTFSLHEVVYLVLSFSKIPSLLKSESGCESYRVFREGTFLPVLARFNQAWDREARSKPGFGPGSDQTTSGLFSSMLGFGPVGAVTQYTTTCCSVHVV
jgi:hypothetical protein